MSEMIKHECGIALIRLLKPASYYYEKYGTWQYGLNKLYLLMEKQHNRGQDGAGMVNIKINLEPGQEYITRYRSIDQNSIKDVFDKVQKAYKKVVKSENNYLSPEWIYQNLPFYRRTFHRTSPVWYLWPLQHRVCSPGDAPE